MTVVRSLNNSGLKPFASERAMPSICQIAFVLLELCRWILIRIHGVLAHCQTHARPVFDDSDQAKQPRPSPRLRALRTRRVRAWPRCHVQLELGPRPQERRLHAKEWSLSCAGYERTTAGRPFLFLDLCLCFCGSFFASAPQQRASPQIDS